MGKTPKPVALSVRLVGLVKRNPWKFATGAIALLAGLPGAWAGVNFLEPVTPAFHYWVRDHVTDRTKEFKTVEELTLKVLRDLQVETAEGKRDAAAHVIDEKQQALAKERDDAQKLKIQDDLRTLTNTKNKLDSQIKTLNRLRGSE